MVKKQGFVSVYDFSRLACKSVDSINKLINEHRLFAEADGTMNVNQLSYFLREEVIKASEKNDLFLVAADHGDDVERYMCYIEEHFNVADRVHFDTVNELVAYLLEKKSHMLDAHEGEISIRYRKNILDTFITRYKAAVLRQIGAICSSIQQGGVDAEISSLPVGVLYSLICFGKNISQVEYDLSGFDFEKLSKAYHSESAKSTDIDANFRKIMGDLGLTDSSGNPVFTREDLTLDFLSHRGELYVALLDKGIHPMTNARIMYRQPDEGGKASDSQKLAEKAGLQISKAYNRSIVRSELADGFYSVAVCGKGTMTEVDALNLAYAIDEGYYNNIHIIGYPDLKSFSEGCNYTVSSAVKKAVIYRHLSLSYHQ